jgi:hypothetical protein
MKTRFPLAEAREVALALAMRLRPVRHSPVLVRAALESLAARGHLAHDGPGWRLAHRIR